MNWEKRLALLPKTPGVYIFRDKKAQILYVGKSVNLRARVSSYFSDRKDLGEKTRLLVGKIAKIETIRVDSEIEALLLESSLIKKHLPRFNVRTKDDKSPLYIRITKETLPKVFVARRDQWDKGDYIFGPFLSSRTVRRVLRLLRRTFPFCSCKSGTGRPCLYADIGLCHPSPRTIAELDLPERVEQVEIYRKNIFNLISFLRGGKKRLIKSLEREMQEAARVNLFEEAARLRNQMQSLQYITSSFRMPADYLANPNLLSDQRRREMDNLFAFLKKAGLAADKPFLKIEAFDISNLSGRNATGSMVTFVLGEPKKELYRRFKIKREKGGDVGMMQEMIRRRLAHEEWIYPDLMVVDGGRGQVGGVAEVLRQMGIEMSLIGLAKKKEKIVFLKNGSFVGLMLDRDSPALYLVQRLRDEAHRFAVTYHRKLREKLV